MNIWFNQGMTSKLAVILTVLLFCSCTGTSVPESSWENIGIFQVTVHQIDVADTITPQDTLYIVLDGHTTPEGRLTLSSIEVNRTPNNISLTIWAEVEKWIGTGIMPPFDTSIHCTYKATPPFDEGEIDIVIEQTDGSQLLEVVQIVN